MVDKNDALFREVNEELRREQFAKIWERYGIYIIAVAVAIIAVISGAKIWESQKVAHANQSGAAFEQAIGLAKAEKFDDAVKALDDIATTGPKGYAALSSLAQAGALLKTDKRQDALVIFDKIVADASSDPVLSDFARVQSASLRLGEADFTEIQNRLKPLTGDDNAWRYIARELIGSAALKAGKLDEARATLVPLLADAGLTRTASERINRLMAQIATAELASTAPAASPAPAAASGSAPSEAPAAAKETEKPASAP